jgi:hypothetical protein
VTPRSSFTRTATIALAAAALAAPAASARPAETPPVAAAADASVSPRPLPGPPTWPVNPQPIKPAPAVHVSERGGLDSTTIGLGIAGSLLLLAGGAAVARHNRRGQPTRVTA